jgi:type IV pilus assembly protein PilY1
VLQNYTALITDGYWNDPDSFNAAIGDSDGDGLGGTIADVADYYYKKDLSPLPNAVSTTAFDKATYQHMVTFGVAFGLQGLLSDPDNDGWPGNSPGLASSDQWGNPFNSDPEKIDDLWHAAFNSKGSFTSAKTPQALANALDKELFDINDRTGSAASVSFNSNALSNGSTVFLAQFALNAATGAVSTNSKWTFAGNPVGAAGLLDARPSPAPGRLSPMTATLAYHSNGQALSTRKKMTCGLNPMA